MSTLGNEKRKLSRLVGELADGTFDENTVDLLFLQLRERSFGNALFQEIGHFVAHRGGRNQGLTRDYLQGYVLVIRYFFIHSVEEQQKLATGREIPAWIKKLMLVQARRVDPARLTNASGLTVDQFVARIKQDFPPSKPGMCEYRRPIVDEKVRHGIEAVMTSWHIRPIFKQEDVVEALIEVIDRNSGLGASADAIRANGDRIMAAILCLLHETQFDLDEKKTARCHVSSSGYGKLSKDKNPDFGKLVLSGEVPLPNRNPNGPEGRVIFTMVATNIDAWTCTDASLHVPRADDKNGTLANVEFNFAGDLGLGDRATLVRV